MERLATSQEDKPLHALYHRQTEGMANIKKSYQWLEKLGSRQRKSNRRQQRPLLARSKLQAAPKVTNKPRSNPIEGMERLRKTGGYFLPVS